MLSESEREVTLKQKDMNSKSENKLLQIKPVDSANQVVSISTRTSYYRRSPCNGCPWKVENAGSFPAQAFRHSAETAYDMATYMFGCHESGIHRPATCAGFLLRGSKHNLAVRLGLLTGAIKGDVTDEGHELFANYRAMAVANGVAPEEDPLTLCRD